MAGQLYLHGKLTPGVLHINTFTGKIEKVAKSTTLERHVDFGNRLILPGAIDVHVHFREPGMTHKEDLATGSAAAAFGGVTGFCDMPNTIPPTITMRALREKLRLMAAKSVVDWGAWAGATWYLGELPEMLRWSVGIKAYLGASTGDLLVEEQQLVGVLTAAAKASKPVALHAEAERILHRLRRQEDRLSDHDLARSPMAEVEAIYDVMKVTPQVPGARVHVAHAASVESVKAAELAKFSRATTPHHLLLDTSMDISNAYGKVNPPLRSPDARKALFEAFKAGRIPVLESDHAPHTRVEKEGAFHDAPSGLPGVETMVPLLLAQVHQGHLPINVVADAVTVNPAQLLGLSDRGKFENGLRADFAVYDLNKPTKVKPEDLHSRCGWSPFGGMPAVFPSHTYLAGNPVVEDGELVAKPGTGRSLVQLPGDL